MSSKNKAVIHNTNGSRYISVVNCKGEVELLSLASSNKSTPPLYKAAAKEVIEIKGTDTIKK